MSSSRALAEELLNAAGITINGSQPWDLKLHSDEVIPKALAYGNLGLGEAYMAGLWDAEALDQFFDRLLSSDVQQQIKPSRLIFHALKNRWFNQQSKTKAWEVGEAHYDLGNDFYEDMLDKRMVYTCGYWQGVDNLDDAQKQKLELTCQKLQLKPGMRILDIGCGWGSFLKYAAENFGVEGVGLTISKEQAELASQYCEGLPVEIRLMDYRDIDDSFDAIVSLGMFEHVGPKNHATFMQVVDRNLKDDGLFLLHTIGRNVGDTMPDPWIAKYIFPNGELPSIRHISSAAERLFVVEDLHNFGADYDKTLMAWHQNFEANWEKHKDKYSKTFYRMWRYYLLSCAGAFRARDIQLWQWVFSRSGVRGGYQRPTLG